MLWAAAAAVLLIHAASQGVAPEFSLPLYPLFIAGVVWLLGEDLRDLGRAEARGPSLPDSPSIGCRIRSLLSFASL